MAGWFRRWTQGGTRRPAGTSDEQARELLDPHHRRASLRDDERTLLNPGQVLDNIHEAMERLDLDINTAISIEEDVVTLDELLGMFEQLRLGPTVMVHVVNTAVAIMRRRYPAELVDRTFGPSYDLRQMTPIQISDELHDIAVRIFNLRTISDVDLVEGDVAGMLDGLDGADQATVFTALIYMYGTKISALKTRTGIE